MRVNLLTSGLAVLATIVVVGQQNPYVGRWNLAGTGPDSGKVYWLEVTAKGDQLAGRFLDRVAHARPLAWVRVENNELAFQYGRGEGTPDDPVKPCGPIYRARIENGKLMGHHTPAPCVLPGATPPAPPPTPAKEIRWIGTRQPVWPPSNANATHAYGKPVVLIGSGVGLEVWGRQGGDDHGKANGWKIADGILTNDPPTYNPVSKEKFKDFKIETEFKLDADQNSGLYLRGRYELQMALGSGPAATHGRQGMMAIYGWKAADVDAAKPAGEWQSLEAIIVGNHLTATLNGKRIHDNAVLPAMTGGAIDNDEFAPGPIMIQGDHSHVALRKMVVTPIVKPGT
jgi:3-keto-disaccharide hydrolase